MTTAVTEHSPEQVELIRRTIAKGATDDELALFLNQCKRTGLDPFSRQIHAVKRWDGKEKREVMTIQVGIDGFRLVAERTERYAPGREPSFAYDEKGNLLSATAFVKKFAGGVWHEVARTAFYSEFVQTTKEGTPNRFWGRMPHLMLAKCAEALALRASFPMELSGLYSPDEIGVEEPEQASGNASPPPQQIEHKPEAPKPPNGKPKQSQAQPSPRTGPPVTGPELLHDLEKYDRILVKDHIIGPGDLLRHIHGTFDKEHGPDITKWPVEAIQPAMDEAKQFHGDMEQRATEARQGEQAATIGYPDGPYAGKH